MADNRPHFGSGDALSADLIAQRGFATIFRGFDPSEVREFLAKVASEVRELRERAEQAEIARQGAEERALHPKLDEETLLAAVGEETAAILRMARAASADIRTKAEEQATALLREAQAQADALRAQAEGVLAQRTAEAEAAAEALRGQAAADVERIRALARQETDSVRHQAEQERRLTVEAAQSIREKILSDLSRRRRVASVQIEQLRAGRERLLDAYMVVRRTLDEVTDELQRADAEARAAADAVGRRAAEDPGDMLVDLTTGAIPPSVASQPDTAATSPVPGQPRDPVTAPVPVMPATPGTAGSGGPEQGAVPVPSVPTSAAAEPSASAESLVGPVASAAGRPGADATGADVSAADPATTGRGASEASGVSGPATAVGPSDSAGSGGDLTAPPENTTESVHSVQGGSVVTTPRTGRSRTTGRRSGPPDASRSPLAKPNPYPVAAPGEISHEPERTEAVDDNVEGLFARIRADRAGAVATARKVLGHESAGRAEPVSAEVPAADAPVPDADEVLLQRRDETSAEIEVALARRLKRVLQDEQNDLLDRLRGAKGTPKARNLLPSQGAERERIASAAQPLLEQAAMAGVRFGRQMVGLDRDAAVDAGTVRPEALAAALAAAVTNPLHRRLEQAFTDSAGDEQAVLVEALGAAYREWKTQRIEALAGDHVAGAFSQGAFDAVPDGTPLRWLAEDVDGPCPDCDDNALAGSLLKGEEYPTGQRYPPAHPGCRCLLVIDTPDS